ncbi:hypothetical protein [Gemmata sp.]|uniref:hypothetical protein n=1 Tax=Gemmata sp. TaxID=1914242 RepID=UPI003F6E729F
MPAPVTPADLPPTCEIRAWPVFVHGFHKGDNYPPADLERMVANFRLLSVDGAELRDAAGGPLLKAKVKLGHDRAQRLAALSLGLPNIGRVRRLEMGADGRPRVWADNVPTKFGGLMNGGHIDGGSIEIIPDYPDPRDPARKIAGPIMTGVSLLGEERPAVLDVPRPYAVFADGTPVPPDHDVASVLGPAMEVARRLAAAAPAEPVEVNGRTYAARSLFFSAAVPQPTRTAMTPEQEAALAAAGFSPEQIAAMKAALPAATGTTMSAPPTPPKPGDGGELMTAFKAFADEQKAFNADCTKRMGAMEAAAGESQKKAAEGQMAARAQAFSAGFDAVAARHNQAEVGGKKLAKMTPAQLAAKKKLLLDEARGQTFAADSDFEAHRTKVFADLAAEFAALPTNPLLVDQIDDRGPATGTGLSPAGRKLLDGLRGTNPRVHERLSKPAAA